METEISVKSPADYLIRNKLLDQRKIFLWGQVDDQSSKIIVEQITYLEAIQPGVPIHMYINCPGGMVTAGNAMYDIMQAVSSPVYTYCIGFAASMGATLLSGGAKGNRYIYPTAEVMIHQPSIGSFQGNSADIEINARQIIKARELTARILARNCGHSKEKIQKDIDRDYWMNAEEALAYGIVDMIIA
ncbi:MAG: ATP-dependent Clp protease proteolytic subunit [Flavipsychrobacter sp.]|nr:ATP-dependent Clp protease proteolytic subunit [Flavipsychrobacter sp.]